MNNGGWNAITRQVAADWLAKCDAEARAQTALMEASDRDVTRSGVEAAWVSAAEARSANRLAKWAIALSVLAIIMSVAIGILAVFAQLAV
ncbi:MAG: hypothetical protein V4523_19335 [Pseudomonadota bacterium]